jgi:hypothetical protein
VKLSFCRRWKDVENEVYAFALESALDEIQNACPDVISYFTFKDRKVLSRDQNTKLETASQAVDAFDAMVERADPIGDLETITIKSTNGKVNIVAFEDFHLATVSSKEADEKYINTLTRVLIPIVIKLSEKIQPASPDKETIAIEQPESEPEEDDTYEASEENLTTEETEEANNENQEDHSYEEETATPEIEEPERAEPEIEDEPMLPEPPVTQLIVENLGGLLVPSDIVRVDQEVITRWSELYGDNKIKEVEVEALNGKTTRCKFKKIKKSKDTGKGIIKIPEKIQLTLETQLGELVTIKPIIE